MSSTPSHLSGSSRPAGIERSSLLHFDFEGNRHPPLSFNCHPRPGCCCIWSMTPGWGLSCRWRGRGPRSSTRGCRGTGGSWPPSPCYWGRGQKGDKYYSVCTDLAASLHRWGQPPQQVGLPSYWRQEAGHWSFLAAAWHSRLQGAQHRALPCTTSC